MRLTFAQRSFLLTIFAVVATGTAFATVGVSSLVHQGRSMGDPVVFLEGVVRQIARNDYATAWQTLEPAQQRLVPVGGYVRCESASPIPGHLASIRVLRSFDERVNEHSRLCSSNVSTEVGVKAVDTNIALVSA